MVRWQDIGILVCDIYKDISLEVGALRFNTGWLLIGYRKLVVFIVSLKIAVGFKLQLGVHNVQQASRKAEPRAKQSLATTNMQ